MLHCCKLFAPHVEREVAEDAQSCVKCVAAALAAVGGTDALGHGHEELVNGLLVPTEWAH
jgi:hypothetical protein